MSLPVKALKESLLSGAAPLPTHCHKSLVLGAIIFWHQVISNLFFFLSTFPFLTPMKKSFIKLIHLKLGDSCAQFQLVPWAQLRDSPCRTPTLLQADSSQLMGTPHPKMCTGTCPNRHSSKGHSGRCC